MDLELTLDAREAQGKANRRLRRTGVVPGVVYGKGIDSTPVQVDAKTFETLYRAAGRTSVVKFRLPGASRATSGLIKSVQRNPLSGNALHVDFFLVNLRQEMELDIPVVFTGEAPAVGETGGTLLHSLSQVRVKALPNDMPHEITVDVSSLVTLDDAIHVGDLELDRGAVTVLTDPDALVAAVVPPRAEEPTPEELAAAEAEAAEPAFITGGDAGETGGGEATDGDGTADAGPAEGGEDSAES
jgi:large subunit ribosomal protein L25